MKKNNSKSAINQIIIKFLKDDSDFLNFRLSDKYLKEFLEILNNIEKRVPKENIEKLSKLKEKNQDPRLLIETIFDSEEDRYKELLISNFENNLMSSSRASDKLIILYRLNNTKFVIIHSKLKKSLYSHTKGEIDYIKIEKSLLDQKDFLRIVYFEKTKSIIYVKIKEISQSKFFDRWLNFKRLRKSYNRALTIEVELASEILLYSPDLTTFYKKIQNDEIKIDRKKLVFVDQGEVIQNLKISSIEFEDKVYSNEEEYISFLNHFYMTQRYPELNNLTHNFKIFLDNLKETLIGWSAQSPSNKIELFENLKSVYSTSRKDIIFKKNKFEDIDYIICSGEYPNCSINPDEDFFDIIAAEIGKNIPLVKILHLSEVIDIKRPFKVNSLLFMNRIEIIKSYEVLEKNLNRLLESRRDKKLLEILKILKLCIFIECIKNSFIKYFFNMILNDLCVDLDSNEYLDKELKIMEFKSKKTIEGKSLNDIKSYFMDLAIKYCHYYCKFVIIGIEDKDKIDGVDGKYFSSDIIGEIQENLEPFLQKYNRTPFLQHIRIEKNKFLIVFIIF